MTGLPIREWADFPATSPDRHPETLAWVALIEAMRLEDAPAPCPTYRASAGGTSKRCPRCERTLTDGYFYRNRARPDGLSSWCACCVAEGTASYRRRRAVVAIHGTAAS